MTFLNPIFFWSFLSLIPLTAVYFLKVRPRRKPTTAYFLWQRIFQEKRSNRLFQRLRDLWSLLLMALAFAAVCLALTNPQPADDSRKDVLLVLDTSASMSAADGLGSRLDHAKRVAGDIVKAFNGAQRAAVATVSNRLQYQSHLTDNPRELLESIEGVQSSDLALDVALLDTIRESSQWSDQFRVILISDGCFSTAALPDDVELLKVGEPRENIGIVSADGQYLPGGDNRLSIYLQLASTFKEEKSIEVMVTRHDGTEEGQLIRLVPLNVGPGVNGAEVVTVEDAEPGRFELNVDLIDALEKDNQAFFVVDKPPPIRVAVQSEDRFFFENSVVAFSRGSGLLTLDSDNPQIVMAKGGASGDLPAVIFQPANESVWWSDVGEELEGVVPQVLVEDHPALRHLDPMSIPFTGARSLSAPPGAQIIMTTQDGTPLVYRTAREGKSAIVVNMDPVAAEFYYSAWFPVLVHSSATYLAGRESVLRATYPTGSAIALPGAREQGNTQQTDPTGTTIDLTGTQSSPLNHVGFYQFTNANGTRETAASLLSQQETLIDNESVQDTSQPISRGWPLAYVFTLGALLVVSAESLLYQRRKVG